MRLLLVEDDPMLGEAVASALGAAMHSTDWVTRRADAEAALRGHRYDAALIDLGLPDSDGGELIAALRAEGSDLPILIISARDQITDRVKGLDAGADDYLIKPFDIDELLARLRAAARRHGGSLDVSLRAGAVEVDVARCLVHVDGRPVPLAVREYQLLVALMERRGRVLSRSQLEDALYAWGDEVDSNAVEVHIHHLRKKIGRTVIRTVRGHGYVIDESPAL